MINNENNSSPGVDLVQIGDLAEQLGITTRTIRYYEEIGLMGLSQRVGTGARQYGRDEIRRLKFILKLKNLGIDLKEMRELADHFDAHNQSFNSQQRQFSTITPRLLEILDLNIHKVDEKISTLSSLRKDIVDYRLRILNDLKEQKP
ncbi:MAG: MerR family transcriptional regulator [Desulfuromonadaceae bacterium]|nr:MerR family transcriptional regulator [Desulfuromonadaceae bacterium]MDT8422862.1 MerR family transcriptional regulator [Desulfuromonadales bacterium]